MMLGERNHHPPPHPHHHPIPSIQVPPWPIYDDPPTPPAAYQDLSLYLLGEAAPTALQRFLPSNDPYISDEADDSDLSDPPIDAYSCDEFRMYEFKVRRCARGRSHDWTECPYAHPGEKARRRDPRKYHYSGTACPDFRKGSCKRGDSCEFAHGVFECWLHPARYRTQPCKDGVNCRRRVCFFAHTPEQLRVLPQSAGQQQSPRTAAGCDSYDGSPLRQQHHASLEAYFPKNMMSPTSTLVSPPFSPPSDSPPLSPSAPSPVRRCSATAGSSVNEVLVSLRQLQLNKAKSVPSSWGLQQQQQQVGSQRGMGFGRSGLGSMPNTPTRSVVVGGCGLFDGWEEPVERVVSGRDLRARVAEKLSMENSLERSDDVLSVSAAAAAAPDVGWVSDLLN